MPRKSIPMAEQSDKKLIAKACNGRFRNNAVKAIDILNERGHQWTGQQTRAIKNLWGINIKADRGSNADLRTASFRSGVHKPDRSKR